MVLNDKLIEVRNVQITSLFLNANMTDPACSAAFPTMGSNIMLIKLTEIPQEFDAS